MGDPRSGLVGCDLGLELGRGAVFNAETQRPQRAQKRVTEVFSVLLWHLVTGFIGFVAIDTGVKREINCSKM